MEIQPHVAAIVIGGVALTMLMMPKNRRFGYAIYLMVAVFVMMQLLDTGTLMLSIPNVAVGGDPTSLMPVLLITGLLAIIVLMLGKEKDEPEK